MRVLVTRPTAQAALTADRLRRAGHEPVIASVTTVEAVELSWPDAPWDAVLATSPNALRLLPGNRAIKLTTLPIHVVGQATGEAARNAGFRDIRISAGHATALAADVLAHVAPGARLLYLAGMPRKPVLEETLQQAGRLLDVVVLYCAVSAPSLPAEVAAALRAGGVDAVLHHSREAAMRFADLVIDAGLQEAARHMLHLCLSADVGAGLARLDVRLVRIAPEPTEAALLTLLDERR